MKPSALEQDHAVMCAIGDGLVTSRQIGEALQYLSLRQIAAACGRLRKRGVLKGGEMRCAVCDGRGRVRTWQKSADYPQGSEARQETRALASNRSAADLDVFYDQNDGSVMKVLDKRTGKVVPPHQWRVLLAASIEGERI